MRKLIRNRCQNCSVSSYVRDISLLVSFGENRVRDTLKFYTVNWCFEHLSAHTVS